MKNYLKTHKPSECCGCSACANICSKQSIIMQPNEEGFLYPIKNTETCIDCGLCEKVCPFSSNYSFETTDKPLVYAAYDKYYRIGSSSGGIFVTLSKYVIEQEHGWVFGAAFDTKFQLHHEGVSRMEDLTKLRGSKYVQSRMGDIYRKIKLLLNDGIYVFFVGTPCQVAGLRSFLRKDYDNLLLADLVCHGVPSQMLFDEHVKYLEKKYNATLTSYQFRKGDGWGGCEIADFANPEKHKTLPSYHLSPYLHSFIDAMTYRESCYDCKFAKIPRQGDITLADYWGVTTFFPDLDSSKGVSLVLTNTSKGEKVFKIASKDCITRVSNIKDASLFNGNLIKRSKRPAIRDGVYNMINKDGYAKVAKKHFRPKNYLLVYIKSKLLDSPLIYKLNLMIRHRK